VECVGVEIRKDPKKRVPLRLLYDYPLNSCVKVRSHLRNKLNLLHTSIKVLQPTGHVMPQQFNIQQLYALPTLYLYVLYLSENKQRLVLLTA
jgi:hypothetical protein